MAKRETTRWAVLAVMYLCTVSYAMVSQCIPPVMALIIEQFLLTHHQAGLLMSLFALPAIFIALPAGMLSDRYGVKPVGIITLMLTIAGTVLVATGQTFAWVLTGRVIMGTGAISLVIICPQAVARWFVNKEMGIAMGVYNSAVPVGVIASLNVMPALASLWGWRSAIWLPAALAALVLVLLALFYTEPAREPGERRENTSNTWRLGKAGFPVSMCGAAWALFNAAVISLLAFAPVFMVHSGLALGTAGFNTSLVMGGSLVLSPFIGYLVDRFGYKEAFIAGGGLGMALLLLLVPGGRSHFSLLMAAIGAAAAFVPAPVYSLVADVVRREQLGLGYGIFSTLNNVGVFVGPQLVGLSRDMTGSYTASFFLMALFAFLITASMAALKARRA